MLLNIAFHLLHKEERENCIMLFMLLIFRSISSIFHHEVITNWITCRAPMSKATLIGEPLSYRNFKNCFHCSGKISATYLGYPNSLFPTSPLSSSSLSLSHASPSLSSSLSILVFLISSPPSLSLSLTPHRNCFANLT